jgi:Regulator of ribonuclease activity B
MGKLKRMLGGGRRRGGGGGQQETFPVEQGDIDVVQQLLAQGRDLSGPVPVHHRIAFGSGDAAEQAASRLPNRGFDVQVQQAPGAGTVVVATRSERVTPESVAQVRGHLTRLADRLGGTYQGWSLDG